MFPVKVSVCIPAYNQPECLKTALKSIQAQSFNAYEIIVTDDSHDTGIENILKLFSFGGKLKYYKNTYRLGSPENWNESIRRATGEYIKILHHDDWFTSPQSLGEYVKMLDEHPESDFAFSATNIYHSNDGTFTINCPSGDKLDELKKDPLILFFGNFVGAPSATIFRRNIGNWFDYNIKYVVDIDFYIRVIKHNPVFQFNKNTLIGTKSGAIHQVTAESTDKNSQLYEYSYLYNKIRPRFYPGKRFINFFSKMISYYDIRSLNEFKQAGAVPKPTFFLHRIIQKRNWELFKNRMKVAIIKRTRDKKI